MDIRTVMIKLKKIIPFNKEISKNDIIYPKAFKKEIKTFYDNTDQNKRDSLIQKIEDYHQSLKKIARVDLKKVLKIQYIKPEFEDSLLEAFQDNKDNDKLHRENKAKKR